MKTFRLIGMALITVLMCVNFTSCSSDDEEPIKNDDGVITNEKKLVEIKGTDAEDGSFICTFSYDSKGRLISITNSWNSKDYYIHFTWGNNTIIATSDDDANTYTLTDNLVRKQQGREYTKTFTYNSSNQLIRVDEMDERYSSDDCSNTYTWDNGKMTKYVEDNSDVYEYTYSGKTCKGWFPYIDDESWEPLNDDGIFFAHPELIGMRTNQLPEQEFNKDIYKDEYYDERYKETYKYESTDENTTKFDYTLNKDGYLESCTVTYTSVETTKRSFEDKNGDGIITADERDVTETYTYTETTIYTFKWE